MFGYLKSLVNATSKKINTTSKHKGEQILKTTTAMGNNFAKVIEHELSAVKSLGKGVLEVGTAAVFVGAGVIGIGSAVGMGFNLSAALNIAKMFSSNATMTTLNYYGKKIMVGVIMNSEAVVAGGTGFHTFLNRNLFMNGFKDIGKALESEVKALYYLSNTAKSALETALNIGSFAALKAFEVVEKIVGSDQDGYGLDNNMVNKTLTVKDLAPDLDGKKQEVSDEQLNLNKAINIVNQAISQLDGDNATEVTVKNIQEVARQGLVSRQGDFIEKGKDLETLEEMLEGFELVDFNTDNNIQEDMNVEIEDILNISGSFNVQNINPEEAIEMIGAEETAA